MALALYRSTFWIIITQQGIALIITAYVQVHVH